MINKEILEYIGQQSKQGFSRDVITNNLLTGGWQQQDIHEGFSKFEKENQKITNTEQRLPISSVLLPVAVSLVGLFSVQSLLMWVISGYSAPLQNVIFSNFHLFFILLSLPFNFFVLNFVLSGGPIVWLLALTLPIYICVAIALIFVFRKSNKKSLRKFVYIATGLSLLLVLVILLPSLFSFSKSKSSINQYYDEDLSPTSRTILVKQLDYRKPFNEVLEIDITSQKSSIKYNDADMSKIFSNVISVSPNGRYIYGNTKPNDQNRVYDYVKQKFLESIPLQGIYEVKWDQLGQFAYIRIYGNKVTIIDLENDKVINLNLQNDYEVVGFSKDNSRLILSEPIPQNIGNDYTAPLQFFEVPLTEYLAKPTDLSITPTKLDSLIPCSYPKLIGDILFCKVASNEETKLEDKNYIQGNSLPGLEKIHPFVFVKQNIFQRSKSEAVRVTKFSLDDFYSYYYPLDDRYIIAEQSDQNGSFYYIFLDTDKGIYKNAKFEEIRKKDQNAPIYFE